MYFYFLLAILSYLSFQGFLLGKNINRIKNVCNTFLKLTAIFAVGVTGLFYFFANDISLLVYKSLEASNYIKLLSLLVVFMYIDNIIDGMLKGINEHVSVMLCNILDLVVTICIIFFAVPFLGMNGYVLSIFVSEILNFSVSLYQLKRRVNFSFPFLLILKCFICVFASFILTCFIFFENVIFKILVFIAIYLALTFIFKCYIFKK